MFDSPWHPTKCITDLIKLAHDVAHIPALLKQNQKGGNHCSLIEKALVF